MGDVAVIWMCDFANILMIDILSITSDLPSGEYDRISLLITGSQY